MDDVLAWLFARQRFGVRPGLERTRALLTALGEPARQFESVLVGGTNGKGSTAATLANILQAGGSRTALFTSPHLTRFSERFVIDGEPVADDLVATTLAEIRPYAERQEATFFEIVTALGCLLFARAGVERAVMEVGLGGRFDATNVLEPVLSIVTGVARDHTKVLGETVGEIARDKAGIMRTGRLCLTGATGAALTVLKDEAERVGARLWAVEEEIRIQAFSRRLEGLTVDIQGPLGKVKLESPLIGLHQARNVALAGVAAQVLEMDGGAIRQGAAGTRWPGRLEPLRYRDRVFLLDGAHNPQAAEALAAALLDLGVRRALFIFGMSNDKEIAGIVAPLQELAKEVVLTRAKLSPRAAEPRELQAFWDISKNIATTLPEAVEAAVRKTEPGELIVVAGSLYLIGEIRPLLLGEGLEPFERWQ